MRSIVGVLCAFLLWPVTVNAAATTWYVATNGNDGADGTSWATAKQTIQAAIDLAVSNDTVLVSNGVYATGGRVVYGAMTNRLVITKAVTVQSVNGPSVTVIQGAHDPITANGDAAVRCAYVGTNATLSGFALVGGATRRGGDIFRERGGGGAWCEDSGVVSNCTLVGNSADSLGGGSFHGTLNNCTLSGNSSDFDGGGAYYSGLNDCTLIGNSAKYSGGGVSGGTLNRCILTANSTIEYGGAVCGGSLYSCALFGNFARDNGGGVAYASLYNCTLSGNSAQTGGGAFHSVLYNCVAYFNTAVSESNHFDSSFKYSCTTPDPGGIGNITNDPGLADVSHLSVDSPCIGAGSSAYVFGADIDGETWRSPPSMGCDEVNSGAVTGNLAVAISASSSNVAIGCPVDFTAWITGCITRSAWFFGDGESVSNQPYLSHAYPTGATYSVVLWACNETYPGGVSATVLVQVAAQMIHYVLSSNLSASAPYKSWTTAATNIQDAIDVAAQVGALILVSNGVYETGGRVIVGALTNRVVIDKRVTVRSVNGPVVTVIKGTADPITTNGDSAVRCAYVGANAVLSGFTLTNGHTRGHTLDDWFWYNETSGGGAWCETFGILSNCVLSGNFAGQGGGANGGVLRNCTLAGNSANDYGGGVSRGVLNNCALFENYARVSGGGACLGFLYSCVLSNNVSGSGGGGSCQGFLYSCTLLDNSARMTGGGASDSTLNNCTLSGNSADISGGGAAGGTLNGCVLSGNSSLEGGGAYEAALSNCVLTGNSAQHGGGAYEGSLYNCTLSSNSAEYGGGVEGGDLYNCTLTGNTAVYEGGGSCYNSWLNNCIVYFNTAPTGANYSGYGSSYNHSCTTPEHGGTGNIANDPQFVDAAAGNYRLRASSQCIDGGDNAYAPGAIDLDGSPRIAHGIVDMGAYEFQGVQGYWSWAGAIANGLTNLDQCATGDGYPNLLKYATGSSPVNPDDLARTAGELSNGFVSLRFNRNTNAAEVTLIVECANSISNGAVWNGIATNINDSWGGATNVAETGTANPHIVTVQDTDPTTNRFLRLRVSRP